MGLIFDWDARKASLNQRKHGVSFREAASAFGDRRSLTIPDPDHSIEVERQILIGRSMAVRIVLVVFTEWDDAIRIISARRTTPTEQRDHGEA